MASLSFPALPPPVSGIVPTAAPALPVGPVQAVVPAMLLQADIDGFPLPTAQPAAVLAAPAGAAADGAAMRPDQVAMARQLQWPAPDAGALAGSWRGMVRGYGNQLVAREIQARPGQLPTALLQTGQDAQALRQMIDLGGPPYDAWRFTVHAGGAREQHLRVIGEQEGQPEKRQRRRRAALRLELVLDDGSVVTVQAEPVADGVALELCAPDARTAERLRALQPRLEEAVRRAGLRVLAWTWRDTLPVGPVHARLPSIEAAAGLSLPVFRAMAEMALLLPVEQS